MRVLYLIGDGFRPEEYFYSKGEIENAGIDVTTAGARAGDIPAREISGQPKSAKSDLSFDDVTLEGYDAVVVPGGSPGWENLYKNSRVLDIIRKSYERGMLVASMCASPAVLAKSGILKGKKATIFPGMGSFLKKGGATPVKADSHYDGREVIVRDGNIITANGPWASNAFGRAIVEALKG